ncbi:hypothetical protein HIM_08341 [Hirsutella minnesotensis 3608]|uniref:Peptidase M43 pregnancy-associated plasma-A domain-containing protein n=1 Tax=Hirsutella minnesotensis 3608 TaxID=1043627 RepID=A0A0F7ZMN3_9HYPO|nr:hypothetical protein HIM_08341 [Hirsutella minnesotensis 3608]
MALRYTILAGFLAAKAVAQPRPNTPMSFSDCGTSNVGQAYLSMVQNFTQNEPPADSENSPVEINVFAHIVVAKEIDKKFLNNETIQAQMRVLDETFAPSNTRFKLIDLDQTVDETWALGRFQSKEERAMKQKLRKGTYDDLNIYFMSIANDENGNETGGWCRVPDDTNIADTVLLDGCTVNSRVVLGGQDTTFNNMGKTLTHEVGHWMGLRHPFQGGCDDEAGDSVADTPAMSYDATKPQECNEKLDTCPGKPGFDPVHNYMAYTSDECRTEFTKGQMTLMRQFMAYRTSQTYFGPGGPGHTGSPQPEPKPDPDVTNPGDGKPGPANPQPQPSLTTIYGPERTVYATPEDEERARKWHSDEDIDDILREVEEQERQRAMSG